MQPLPLLLAHTVEQQVRGSTAAIVELIAFVDGRASDAEVVANGCTMTWSNGMVEGVWKSSTMDQTQLLWTSRISAAATPCRGSHPTSKEISHEDEKARCVKVCPACSHHTSASRSLPPAFDEHRRPLKSPMHVVCEAVGRLHEICVSHCKLGLHMR